MDLVQGNEAKLQNGCDATSIKEDDDVDYKKIKLKYSGKEILVDMESANVKVFNLTSKQMKLFGLFSEILSGCDFSEKLSYVEVPTPDIAADTLCKIVVFCTKYDADPYEITVVDPSNITISPRWYCDYLCISSEDMIELYRAAVYLDIDPLIELLDVKILCDTIKPLAGGLIDLETEENIEFAEENTIRLIANEDAVNVDDVGRDLNVNIRHRLCEDFHHIFLEAADATDGTSEGTGKMLKDSISKFGVLRRIYSGISDQKITENQGLIKAKGVTQSTDFKQVYNEVDDDGNKEFINTFCTTHVVVGISDAFADALKPSYTRLQELGVIKYDSFPVYTIRDVLKFFTSTEDGIKWSLDEEFRGYLLQNNLENETRGMSHSFADTREPYAFRDAARTHRLCEIILKFLVDVEFSVAPSIINKFEAIHQSPDIGIYLQLLQIWGDGYVEPLKCYRINSQCDQFMALSSILIGKYHMGKQLSSSRKLLFNVLGIGNVINKHGYWSSTTAWDEAKLLRYGSDLNYVHIKKVDGQQSYKITAVTYPDLFSQYSSNHSTITQVAMCLLRLNTLITSKHVRISNDARFKAIWSTFIKKAIDIWSNCPLSLPPTLYFWNQLLISRDDALFHDAYKMITQLFTAGLEAAINKTTQRLTARDVTFRFINTFIKELKLIMASNDIVEGLIGALKRLHYASYITAGELLSFKRNDTRNNIIGNEALYQKAGDILFNQLPGHRKLVDDERKLADEHAKEVYENKRMNTEKERKIKRDRKAKKLELFYDSKHDFYGSRQEFIQAMDQLVAESKNKYSAKVNFMLDRLRYFKYTLGEEQIVLSSYKRKYEKIEKDVFKYVNIYKIWSAMDRTKEKEQAVLQSINKPDAIISASPDAIISVSPIYDICIGSIYNEVVDEVVDAEEVVAEEVVHADEVNDEEEACEVNDESIHLHNYYEGLSLIDMISFQ